MFAFGLTLAKRPIGQRIIAALWQHKAGHVVIDRLFRDAADALNQRRAWDKDGIALHLVDVSRPTINTAAAIGRMFLAISPLTKSAAQTFDTTCSGPALLLHAI